MAHKDTHVPRHSLGEAGEKEERRFPWWLVAVAVLAAMGLYARFGLIGYATTGYLLLALAAVIALFRLLKPYRVVKRVFIVLLAVGVLALTAAEIPVLRQSAGDKDADAPYLIVLGAGLDGSVPSLSLVNRLTAARDYLEQHPRTVVIVSGGQGDFEDITEAEAMDTWLTAHGVAGERILRESRATSTKENLQFSFDLIRERGDDPADGVAIVSSEYHLYRARCMAEKLGATPRMVAGKTTLPFLRVNYFLREAFAVWYMWVFGIS